MNVHLQAEEFRDRFGGLSKKRFLSQFSVPFLLVEMIGGKKTDGFSSYARTSTLKQPTLPAVKLEGTVVDSWGIPLEKSDRNDFEGMITIGRDINNDVVIPHRSVSKFHAVIRKESGSEEYSVSDVGSLNGTTVNRIPLQSEEPFPLESGMLIVFGKSVQATYFSPEEFHDYMRLMARLKKEREEL
ncbi:MAG: FHA domain-containing protein [Planctomycetota bacterium]|jgi:pSer/pThr/pTyr-binding forkhead associated (FHA) protein